MIPKRVTAFTGKQKKISAQKAFRKTQKARVKVELNEAYHIIESATNQGLYDAQIELLDANEDVYAISINEKVEKKLVSLGFKMGSTEDKGDRKVRNIFWSVENI